MQVKIGDDILSYELADVPNFCGGLRLHNGRFRRAGKLDTGHTYKTFADGVQEYMQEERIPSLFVSDVVGGVFYDYLFKHPSWNISDGGIFRQDGFIYVYTPEYLNTNSGNNVQSLTIINTNIEVGEEYYEDDY